MAVPVLSSLDVTSGPAGGATTVHLGGTGFTGTTGATVGGTAATGVVIVDDTHLTLVTPAHAAGAVSIVVTNGTGPSSGGVNTFTYIAAPVVTSLSVPTGTIDGGDDIVLTGTGFTIATSVLFGATAALHKTIVSDTTINVQSPAGAAGATHITVVSPGGTSATGSGNAFTYVASGTYTQLTGSPVTDDGKNYFMDIQIAYGNVQNGLLQDRFDVWRYPQVGVEAAKKVGS